MACRIDKLLKRNKRVPEKEAEPLQNALPEIVLTAKDAQVNQQGAAVIPQGTVAIAYGAFQNNKQLQYAELPDTVKRIASRAFALCENLREIRLNEGLELIEGNAFNGCGRLKKLVFPNSLKEVHAYAFYCTSLQEPVYNRTGDILHHYACDKSEKSFNVPSQVKVLFEGAFFRNKSLEEAILPEGLERIDRRAFLETNIRRITIPASVKKISSGAFSNCTELEFVNLKCGESVLEQGAFHACPNIRILIDDREPTFEQELRIKGKSLLDVPNGMTVPEDDFGKNNRFAELAESCAGGNTCAMMNFADYFEGMGPDEFYKCAANFWRYRAYKYGDADAEKWKDLWLKEHPKQLIPSVIRDNLDCVAMGDKLCRLGFLFFEPDREYQLNGKDANGIVEVRSWCGEEGPDSDGFGREELYDWWYLDEYLNPIPGVNMIHGYSRHERSAFSKTFDEQYEEAVKAVNKQ